MVHTKTYQGICFPIFTINNNMRSYLLWSTVIVQPSMLHAPQTAAAARRVLLVLVCCASVLPVLFVRPYIVLLCLYVVLLCIMLTCLLRIVHNISSEGARLFLSSFVCFFSRFVRLFRSMFSFFHKMRMSCLSYPVR